MGISNISEGGLMYLRSVIALHVSADRKRGRNGAHSAAKGLHAETAWSPSPLMNRAAAEREYLTPKSPTP